MITKTTRKAFEKVASSDRLTIMKTIRFSQNDIDRSHRYCEENNLYFADLVRLGIDALCDRVGGEVRVKE